MEDKDSEGEKSEGSVPTAREYIIDSARKRQADALEDSTPIKRSKLGSECAEDSEYVIVELDEAKGPSTQGPRAWDAIDELVVQWTILSHDDIVALSSTRAGGEGPAQSF